MSDVPEGVQYKGPSGIARDSLWLTNEDIPHDRDTVVTIESVILRRDLKMQSGRPKPVALSLKFKGKGRELMLNATNRKIITAIVGTPDTSQWYGLSIALFVEKDVRRPDGTKGPAVRIRAKRVTPPTPGQPQQPQVEPEFRGDAESTGGDGEA